jgi:hypothetical protein
LAGATLLNQSRSQSSYRLHARWSDAAKVRKSHDRRRNFRTRRRRARGHVLSSPFNQRLQPRYGDCLSKIRKRARETDAPLEDGLLTLSGERKKETKA